MSNPALWFFVVGVVGFATFIGTFIWMNFTEQKRRLSTAEAIEFARGGHGRNLGTGSVSWWWFRGRAWGFSWSDQMSFGEVKAGVRDGSWRHSARHVQFLLLIAGFLLALYCLVLLIGFEIGPVGLAVAAVLLIFITFQFARGMLRAGSV